MTEVDFFHRVNVGKMCRALWTAMTTYYGLLKGYGDLNTCHVKRLQVEQGEIGRSKKAVAELTFSKYVQKLAAFSRVSAGFAVIKR